MGLSQALLGVTTVREKFIYSLQHVMYGINNSVLRFEFCERTGITQYVICLFVHLHLVFKFLTDLKVFLTMSVRQSNGVLIQLWYVLFYLNILVNPKTEGKKANLFFIYVGIIYFVPFYRDPVSDKSYL